ncbi:MAG: hypothetical protein V1824_03945 [archaeon]
MYILEFTEEFEKEYNKLDLFLRKKIYNKALELLEPDISRKHLKYGLPYFVLKIDKSSRLIYNLESNKVICIKYFNTHKEYEKWFKTYR